MATIKSGNRWALYLAGGLVVLAAAAGIVSLMPNGVVGDSTERAIPRAPDPDSDTPTETMNNLIGRVEEQSKQNRVLEHQNRELNSRLQRLNTTLVSVQSEVGQKRIPQRDTHLLREVSKITQVMGQLANRVQGLETLPKPDLTGFGLDGELPVGVASKSPSVTPPPAPAPDPNEIVWIEPADLPETAVTPGGARPAGRSAPSLLSQAQTAFDGLAAGAPLPGSGDGGNSPSTGGGAHAQPVALRPTADDSAEVTPRYTIPPDSKLIGGTLWTALLGRIPVRGRVPDPWRFSILTGADNLAAKGIHIPNLEGVVWSGVARGDLLLRCVSGDLNSVTFVFKDGTIVNHKSEDSEPLGYISDDTGIPCVSGKLITNAPAYLTGRTGLVALEAAAGAFAANETSSVVSSSGTINSTVDGNTGNFVLGEAVRGGTREAVRWLDDRQGQSFDVIFVRPGGKIAINVEEMLPIDYDTQGRRVSYGNRSADPFRTGGLD